MQQKQQMIQMMQHGTAFHPPYQVQQEAGNQDFWEHDRNNPPVFGNANPREEKSWIQRMEKDFEISTC